jgi:hypothetical protein
MAVTEIRFTTPLHCGRVEVAAPDYPAIFGKALDISDTACETARADEPRPLRRRRFTRGVITIGVLGIVFLLLGGAGDSYQVLAA